MVTIYDVAKEAGVSHTTVSRVLNRKRTAIPMSEETKKRVMEAAGRLNYVPNWAAKTLSTGSANCFCFLLCDRQFTNLFYYHLLKSIEEELSKRGMGLVFAIYKENEELPPMIREKAIDGIFVTGRVTQEIIEKIKETNIPFVVLGEMADKKCDVNQVRPDVRSDVHSVYNYLIGYGHKEIAYISDYKEDLLIREVTEGCKLAYEQHGLKPRVELLKFIATDSYTTISQIIDEHPNITAFIVQGPFAAPFLHITKEREFYIPDKVSVVMYNDELLDDIQRKYFTTFPGGTKVMGKEGVSGLIELCKGLIDGIDITFTSRIKEGKTVKRLF